MSDQQKNEIDEIIRNAHQIVNEAREARKTFMTLSKIMLVLVVGAISTVSILIYTVNNQESKIRQINSEYVPMMFLEGLAQNQNYQTKEVISNMNMFFAKITNDPVLFEQYKKQNDEVQEKYSAFQNTMINQMIKLKGGTTSTTRGLKAGGSPGASK